MLSLPPCAFIELLDFLLLLLLPEMGQRNELGCPLLPPSIPASPVPAKPELREHQVATSSPSPAPASPKGRKVVRVSPSPSRFWGSWDSRAWGRGAQRDTTRETSSLAGVLSFPPFPWLFSSLGVPLRCSVYPAGMPPPSSLPCCLPSCSSHCCVTRALGAQRKFLVWIGYFRQP